jgi:hypothetical protein
MSSIQHLVEEEVSHIPRGERGSPQNLFRWTYTVERQHGKDSTPAEALKAALADVRREHPDYRFRYDPSWFGD